MIQHAAILKGRKAIKSSPKTVRVAVYCRKSNRHGLDDELTSLHVQRETCLDYISSRRSKGWTVIPEKYDDGGFSGASTDRPAFQQLLKDIEAGKIDVVTCYKHDRLSRSFLDFYRVLEFFQKHSVAFVSVTQDFDTSGPLGRLLQNILMSFAEFEREQIRERILDKKAASRRRGFWPGGRPPLGYNIKDKKLVVNRRESELVREIFRRYLEHGSLNVLVRYAMQQGWKTKKYRYASGKTEGGSAFSVNTLRKVLVNPVYAGKIRGKTGLHDGVHEGIIDLETWNQVQHMLKDNRAPWRPPQAHGALLTGIFKCGRCGSTMCHSVSRQGNKTYRYYRCKRLATQGTAACPGSRVAAKDIEGFIKDKIRHLGQDVGVIAQAMEVARAEFEDRKPALVSEIQRLGQLRQKLEAQQETLLECVGDGGERPKAVARKLDLLEEEIEGLTVEQERIRADMVALKGRALDEDDLRRALSDFDEVWAELFPAEQARIVHLLIEGVEYDATKQEVAITYRPGGIQVLAEERNGNADG